uniref:Uncharacterized protein n=1 Tax=Anguilla anguilla TaxID=7936 RepID=A0A0E9UBD9_ANGAN
MKYKQKTYSQCEFPVSAPNCGEEHTF